MSYANWAACMSVNAELYRSGHYGEGFDGSERFLTVQQIMHGTGMLGTFPFIHMGLPQIILPRFDAAAVLEAALRHRATATFFVPGMVTRLADAVADAGLAAAGQRCGGSSTAAPRSPRRPHPRYQHPGTCPRPGLRQVRRRLATRGPEHRRPP